MANTNIAIEIKNLPQIKAAFNKSPKLMTRELNTAIKSTVLYIKGQEFLAYRGLGIRVITGGLWGSIQRGSYYSNLRGEVGPNVSDSPGVEYAYWVHEGTSRMRTRPFLLQAVNNSQDMTDKFFSKAVDDVLNQIGRSV